MLKNLTYRKKNRLLLGGTVLLLLLVYSLAVSKTLTLRSTCDKLEQRVDSAAHLPEETSLMEEKLAALERNFQSGDSTARMHEELLGIVSARCQQLGLVLRDFPEQLRNSSRDWDVETHQFTVEGGFTGLLKLVHALEQQQASGKVVSADYQARRDPRSKALSLTVTIYVQHLIKNSHEK